MIVVVESGGVVWSSRLDVWWDLESRARPYLRKSQADGLGFCFDACSRRRARKRPEDRLSSGCLSRMSHRQWNDVVVVSGEVFIEAW